MKSVNPTSEWYLGVSETKGVHPRCPFATAEECPRFYQSLALLGEAGSTRINDAKDKRLLRKWRDSDLWPITQEQATAISGTEDHRGYHNFCPEVAFERFGYFASYLHNFVDEIDRESAEKSLTQNGTPGDDWRWAWMSGRPMHYSECPIYSVLKHRSTDGGRVLATPSEPTQTRVERYLSWLRNHRVVSIFITIALGLIGLGTLTDSLGKIRTFVMHVASGDAFTHKPLPRSEVSIALHEIKLRRSYGTYDDPLFRFLVKNRGTADASLPNIASISMLRPDERVYTLRRQPFVEDGPPVAIETGHRQVFFDYQEDNHHIAAQLRMGKPVEIKIRVPHIDSDGVIRYTVLDTVITP